MLYDFLIANRNTILDSTEKKTLELAGARPSSEQLKRGLPIFYEQLIGVLKEQTKLPEPKKDTAGMAQAARDCDETAMAVASGNPGEAILAESAGSHGVELERLGYTLSHVVHAYGAMCQAITEIASKAGAQISAEEFHNLNRCLDVAMAGAVTEFQTKSKAVDVSHEMEHMGSLAHEMRNALMGVKVSFELMKHGTVGVTGNTGQALERGLKRIESLIDRSLTEVRLRIDPVIHPQASPLLAMVEQIYSIADAEAKRKKQVLEAYVDRNLSVDADQQLFYSALSNLIFNAMKFTKVGGRIQVRGFAREQELIVEVEDDCGGLSEGVPEELFKPYEQKNENKSGMGLGLSIAQRAVKLNKGEISVKDLPGKGCIFTIRLPLVAARAPALADKPVT